MKPTSSSTCIDSVFELVDVVLVNLGNIQLINLYLQVRSGRHGVGWCEKKCSKGQCKCWYQGSLDESNSTRCQNSRGPCTRRALSGWATYSVHRIARGLKSFLQTPNLVGIFWLYIGKVIYMFDASYCLFIFLAVKWGKRHIKRHLGRPLKKRKEKTLQGESV